MRLRHRGELVSRRCRCRFRTFPFSFACVSSRQLLRSCLLSFRHVSLPSWPPWALVFHLSVLNLGHFFSTSSTRIENCFATDTATASKQWSAYTTFYVLQRIPLYSRENAYKGQFRVIYADTHCEKISERWRRHRSHPITDQIEIANLHLAANNGPIVIRNIVSIRIGKFDPKLIGTEKL